MAPPPSPCCSIPIHRGAALELARPLSGEERAPEPTEPDEDEVGAAAAEAALRARGGEDIGEERIAPCVCAAVRAASGDDAGAGAWIGRPCVSK